jgi:2-oxoglutarate ferredoxin oxidoreductase subunit beta
MKTFKENFKPDFCPGCGNFLIYAVLRKALNNQNIKEKDAVLVFDVGCSGNYADKLDAYSVHTLHGRSIPFACGVKIANPDKIVIVNAGDGAVFHEGINHLIEACNLNCPIVLIVHNNQNFALTKGQKINKEIYFGTNLVKNLGVKFSYLLSDNNLKDITEVFEKAIKNKSLSYIEIMQKCPSFD